MLFVAITESGKKVKTNISLLLLGDNTNIIIPIKKAITIFLYDACKTRGLLVIEINFEKTK
jgi:hypothetical protein